MDSPRCQWSGYASSANRGLLTGLREDQRLKNATVMVINSRIILGKGVRKIKLIEKILHRTKF